MDISKFKLNEIKRDTFGRPSGIIVMNKPKDITSHDLVDMVRAKVNYRKVGHAGALDMFATGVMIILIGKATKMSDKLVNFDKQYKARILLGIATDTQDIEGKILKVNMDKKVSKSDIEDVLKEFRGNVMQHVSAYSSVKVDGKKLRKLMRDRNYAPIVETNKDGEKIINMIPKEGVDAQEFKVKIPIREIKIYKNVLEGFGKVTFKDIPLDYSSIADDQELQYVDLLIDCSKGTYIRQLAEDIGDKLGLPAMLLSLERTKIGDISLEQVIEIDSIS